MRRWWVVVVSIGLVLAGCGSESGGAGSSPSPGQASASESVASCPGGSSPDQPGDATQARPALPEWYQLAAMDPTRPRIIVGASEHVPAGAGTASLQFTWAFDVCTNTWIELGDASLPSPEDRPALYQFVTDPGAGVVRGLPVWTFDPAGDSWSTAAGPGQGAAGEAGSEAVPMAVYDPTASGCWPSIRTS